MRYSIAKSSSSRRATPSSLYSDGITEARNLDGEEFGEERLRDVVQRVLGQSPQLILASGARRGPPVQPRTRRSMTT